MGNQFLGFPVPRARIADMIANATDITPGFGWGDFQYITHFPSSSAFAISKSDGESATFNYNQLEIQTLGTSGSYITISKGFTQANPEMTWEKRRRFKTAIYISTGTDEMGEFFVGMGYWGGTDLHAGFLIKDGVLKASAGNGGTEFTEDIETIGTGTLSASKTLEIDFYPRDHTDYYVNGSKQITMEWSPNNEQPYGTSFADTLLAIDLRNLTNANQLQLNISRCRLWQEE